MDQNERTLWERARAGDRAAFDRLLRDHETSIFRFGLRLCGDEEAAKEVLQRTLISAFENFASFRGESRLSTWLFTLARSSCSRLHRRTRSAPAHDVPLDSHQERPVLVGEGHSPADHVQSAEVAELVSTAIGLLPEDYREVVVLRDIEGLSAEEAAEILQLGIPALKSRLHRARQMLRRHLVTLLREHDGRVASGAPCEELVDTLHAIRDEHLDQAACRTVEEHVSRCESCASTLGELRDAAALCRRLPGGEVPESVRRAVRAAVLDALNAA